MSEAGAAPEPVVIPERPDFPVTWEHPDDQKIPWQHDRMHNAEAMPVLEGEFWGRFMHGMHQAMEHYEIPLQAVSKNFNCWQYLGIFPSVPPEKMQEVGAKSDELVMKAVHGLEQRWNEEWLPEILAHFERWDAVDLKRLSDAELIDHFETMWKESRRLFAIHFEVVFPTYVSLSLFDELHHDLFAGQDSFDAQKLIQGFDSLTLVVDRAIWSLSRDARNDPTVREIIETRPDEEILDALGASDAGRAFLEKLDAFLEEHGKRGGLWGICHTSWIEDPSPVLHNIRDYLSQDGDPEADLRQRAADREAAVAKARAQLEGYPSSVRDEFEALLRAASCAIVLSEDHGYWIDFQGLYRIRRVIVELGARLTAAGVIETANDIFFLDRAGISSAMRDAGGADYKQIVNEGKRKLEHFRTIKPPQFLGTDYGPPPPSLLVRAFDKFFGTPPEPSQEAGTITGHAGSPGKVRGTAKLIGSLREAEKLKSGDILVAETTAAPWTPLFATAGGIVTDTGGILSHCAVVAREYRIPAVVGTGVATSMITDGQTIEVDGDAGTVRIVD